MLLNSDRTEKLGLIKSSQTEVHREDDIELWTSKTLWMQFKGEDSLRRLEPTKGL